MCVYSVFMDVEYCLTRSPYSIQSMELTALFLFAEKCSGNHDHWILQLPYNA